MKERAIIFGPESIRGILNGRKTQTRRAIKPQPELDFHYHGWYLKDAYEWTTCHPLNIRNPTLQRHVVRCPYPAGSRLWVKEPFAVQSTLWQESHLPQPIHYIADVADRRQIEDYRVMSFLFMPRWASRITLEIVSLRVERLHDISYEDIIAEGWQRRDDLSDDPVVHREAARDWFMDHWNAINGKKHPWASNCWLWCIEFKRVEKEA